MTSENRGAIASASNEIADAGHEKKWDCIIDHEDDWDNIIATTEGDFKAGRYAFNSADYATDEEAMEAMRALIHSIAERALKSVASDTSLDAKG